MTPASRLHRAELLPLGPREQLHAGRLGRRLVQLVAGLVLYGVSMALVLRAHLGAMPWDILHQGIARHAPLTLGHVVIATSLVVLLLWWPLRQWPGLGTLANAVTIGLVVDPVLRWVATPDGYVGRGAMAAAGIVLNAAATALYIGAQLGPGPRDGLMTGLARRTGRSLRLVRTAIEVVVVLTGWALGGTIGVATLAYALGVGPLTQAFLPWLTVRLAVPVDDASAGGAPPAARGDGR